MTPVVPEAARMRHATAAVVYAFLAALAVRAAVAWAVPVINSDGPIYIAQAQAVRVGDFRTAVVDHNYPPGTAAIIALVLATGLPQGFAGYLVSVLAGALAVFPLHALVRAAFAPRVALATAFLYAFLPVPARLSASVLTTGLFLFATCLGLALCAQLHGEPRARTALFAGVIAVFAYLVRADGLLLLPFALLAASFARARRPLGRVALGLLVLFPAAAGIGAYAVYGHSGEGLSLSHKLWRAAGERFFDLVRPPGLRSFGLMGEDLGEAVFAPFLPLLALGLLVRVRDGDARIRRALGGAIALWVLGLLKYTDATGIMSKRHMAPIAVLLIPWAVHGAFLAAGATARVLRRGGRGERWAPAATVVLLCLACVPKLARVHEGDSVAERDAGLWLREVAPAGRPILCASIRVPYYAERPSAPLRLTRWPVGNAFYALHQLGVEYVVRDAALDACAPGFVEALHLRRWVLVRRFPRGNGGAVEVYRIGRGRTRLSERPATERR